MVRMYVRHPVQDYDAWRRGFDDFQPQAKQMGARTASVFQSLDDPNDVTAVHDFDDLATARAFAGDPSLKEAMGNAGIAGEPQIWFTEER